MELFPVYPLYDIEPVKANGVYVWDKKDQKYLDFYGGHAVISIGHSDPYYISMIKQQLDQIGFYSNAVLNRLQEELAEKLGQLSGYDDYQLFLCNSGAEANENALKLASFYNYRKKIIAFRKGFHGRTSLALAVTDNSKIKADVNDYPEVIFLELNESHTLEKELAADDVCAVIIEGVQGIGGVYVPEPAFMKKLQELCIKHDTVLILDEVQSGYGRTGKFFAHQHYGVQPDLITVAKGMGNGFPMGGVLINPKFRAKHGMLGTTFGGNHLACAAGIAVLDILREKQLIENADNIGKYLIDKLSKMEQVKKVRGRGLMIGIEMPYPIKPLRNKLLTQYKIFTGSASNDRILRILPPLIISKEEANHFLTCLAKVLEEDYHEAV